MRAAVQKLKNRRGSSLPEAMIGFLIVCMTSLILVGTVTVSGKIMIQSDAALTEVYQEKAAFDVFTYHSYDKLNTRLETWNILFKDQAGSAVSTVETNYSEIDGESTTIYFTDQGYGTLVPANSAYNKSAAAAYCLAKKHKVFCFSTAPNNRIH